MATRLVPCTDPEPTAVHHDLGPDRPCGRCRECGGWLRLDAARKIPAHDRAELI
jgi:hypothetical protein